MAGENPLPPAQKKAIKAAVGAVVARAGDQTKAAARLGLSQGHVSAVVNDKRGVGIDFVMRLADELEQSTDEVLGLAPADDPDPALADALKKKPWPAWVRKAAVSRRNLRGKLDAKQWADWMQGQVTADAVTTGVVEPSAQEEAFEKKRAKVRTRKGGSK